jgi:hypothetical protein
MRSMKIVAFLVVVASLATGCNKTAGPVSTNTTSVGTVQSGSETSEVSIRTAIQAHLAHQGNLNLDAFQTDVKQVTIQGDHAQAQVEFHVKDGPGVMQLTYSLEKRDNAWEVVESEPASGNFSHPALGQGQTPNAGGVSPPVDPMSDPVRFFKSAAPAQPSPGR